MEGSAKCRSCGRGALDRLDSEVLPGLAHRSAGLFKPVVRKEDIHVITLSAG